MDISNQILSDIEREKIIAFCQDTVLFHAVKKYVLAVAVSQGTFKSNEEFRGNINYALQFAWQATEPNGMPRSDEELGQQVRALTQAVKLVESGFKELGEMKEVEALSEPKENPAE